MIIHGSLAMLNPNMARGEGVCQPRYELFWNCRGTAERIALFFYSLWGIFCAKVGEKMARSCQATEL